MATRRRTLQARTLATLAAVACVAMLLHGTVAAAEKRRAGRKSKTSRKAPEAAPVRGSRGTDEVHVHVRRGDTLGGLLRVRGVGGTEADRWVAAAATVYDVRSIRPRRGITLRFDRATRTLDTVRYEIDDHALLLLRRDTDGRIVAQRNGLPYVTEVKGIARVIDHGLRADATAAGVPESVIAELADVFGWEVDLTAGLRRGDEVRLLYENIWQAGERVPQPGRVLGAEIVRKGRKPLTAVYFEDADGQGGYYLPDGAPLHRQMLRYPVEFTEITSEFSLFRRHPVTRRTMPHLGVDFAAPVGTPVRAVAHGTVAHSGWLSYLGQTVRIEHQNFVASTYGHLSGIASGIVLGAPVERGQVIGYVGASGLATGPHLHFGIERNGEYLDPLGIVAAPESRVPDTAHGAFDKVRVTVTRQLAALPAAGAPLTISQQTSDRRAE